MADWRRVFTCLLCSTSIYLSFDGVDGGRRFSSRSRSTRITKTNTKYRGISSKPRRFLSGAGWKAALISGVAVYGATAYMRRGRYRRGIRPTECVNMYDTDDNMTIYKQFICPSYRHSDDYSYCCGEELRQRCCTYRQRYGRGPGKGGIAGIVFGVILVAALVGVICFCVYRKYKGGDKRGEVVELAPVTNPPPVQPGYAPVPLNPQPPYPQPYGQPMPPPMGYEGSGYDDPYRQPAPYGQPPPSPQPGYPPQPPPSYPQGAYPPPDAYPPPGAYPPPAAYPPQGGYPPPGTY